MYLTVNFPCDVESHKGENNGDKGQSSCGDIHEKRPSPWPPSLVELPLEINSNDEFPSIPDVSPRRSSRCPGKLTCTSPQKRETASRSSLVGIFQLMLLQEGNGSGTNHTTPMRTARMIPLFTMRDWVNQGNRGATGWKGGL